MYEATDLVRPNRVQASTRGEGAFLPTADTSRYASIPTSCAQHAKDKSQEHFNLSSLFFSPSLPFPLIFLSFFPWLNSLFLLRIYLNISLSTTNFLLFLYIDKQTLFYSISSHFSLPASLLLSIFLFTKPSPPSFSFILCQNFPSSLQNRAKTIVKGRLCYLPPPP